ncbi:hypothetical protein PG988_015298 [Apiospora saccharicola]
MDQPAFSEVTVLTFNFLEAIEQFKKALPADYIRDSWSNVIKEQCNVLKKESAEFAPSAVCSLLYLQLVFLRKLHRRVLGDVAPESGWKRMATMILKKTNGPEDVTTNGSLFEKAAKKESAEELLAYIASPDQKTPITSITTAVRAATKISVADIIKDEAGNAEADGDDGSEITGQTSASTSGNKKRKIAES